MMILGVITDKIGTYYVTYTAVDSSGNVAKYVLAVRIQDCPPEIHLIDQDTKNDINIKADEHVKKPITTDTVDILWTRGTAVIYKKDLNSNAAFGTTPYKDYSNDVSRKTAELRETGWYKIVVTDGAEVVEREIKLNNWTPEIEYYEYLDGTGYDGYIDTFYGDVTIRIPHKDRVTSAYILVTDSSGKEKAKLSIIEGGMASTGTTTANGKVSYKIPEEYHGKNLVFRVYATADNGRKIVGDHFEWINE